MYYHFLGGITTETNFDLILIFDDECIQIIILFLVSTQYISSSLKNRINLKRIIRLASRLTAGTSNTYLLNTFSINIINACFDHRCSTVVLQTEV